MVDSISLCYFSGTGNTEKIALSFYRILRKSVSVCSVFRMEDHLYGNSRPVLQNSIVGLLFPVHFHTPPHIVREFIKNASFAPFTKVFIIAVSSDNAYLNKTALLSASKLVEKKQADIFLQTIIPMPRNIIYKYPSATSKQLHDIAEKRIHMLSYNIVELKTKKANFSPVHHAFLFLSFYTAFISKKFGLKLSVSQKCTNCGLCIRNCPASNIAMDIGIKFQKNCTLCMRCIYYCPVNAIVPRWFSKLPVTGGYDLEAVLNSPFAKIQKPDNNTILPKNLRKYLEKYTSK